MTTAAERALTRFVVDAVHAMRDDPISPVAAQADVLLAALAAGAATGQKRRLAVVDERGYRVRHGITVVHRDLTEVWTDQRGWHEARHSTSDGPRIERFAGERILVTREIATGERVEIELKQSGDPAVCIVVVKLVARPVESQIVVAKPSAYRKRYRIGYDDERMRLLEENLEKGDLTPDFHPAIARVLG